MITLATPTPVSLLAGLSTPATELWIKRDDATSDVYGGNKARKLRPILEAARGKGAARLLTVGALGSHHVLATTVFGRQEGFEVEAVLVPQPPTDHAKDNLRAALGAGLVPVPVGRWAYVPFAVAARLRAGTFFIPVGGSTPLGAGAYVAAAQELVAQVRAGLLPAPEVVVVTVGSGGTAAGLAVGFAAAGLPVIVHGVVVSGPVFAVEALTTRLVRKVARAVAGDVAEITDRALRSLVFDGGNLGAGYGADTPWGARARASAARVGLGLDATYTAKAFARALDFVADGAARRVLYWHTLAPHQPARWLAAGPSREACVELLPTLFPR